MLALTNRQWTILIVFCIMNFFNAICVSLQAPFYPKEAEKKGATASEYGFVFGIYELVVFILSPFLGQNLNKIGIKLLLFGGTTTTATCSIIFGFLVKVQSCGAFIILSALVRGIEAAGNAAFLTATFSILATEFPQSVATTFAILEAFFGAGLILGPTIGAFLYEMGGFVLPFATMGVMLLLASFITVFFLPQQSDSVEESDQTSYFKLLRISSNVIDSLSIICTSISLGFIQSTLVPHLKNFQLTPLAMSSMFIINGGVYAVSTPIWGWLCDHYCSPRSVTFVGALLIGCAFTLIGPVSFLPIETSIETTIIGLVLFGLGMAAQLVSSFADALKATIVKTYGLVTGLWASMFALGAFIGPSISGVLFDSIGFRQASILVILLQVFVILVVIYGFFKRGVRRNQNNQNGFRQQNALLLSPRHKIYKIEKPNQEKDPLINGLNDYQTFC